MPRLGSDGGGNGKGYSERDRRSGSGSFAGILADEQKKTGNTADISLQSMTYSNKGVPNRVYVMMRDYTYQN